MRASAAAAAAAAEARKAKHHSGLTALIFSPAPIADTSTHARTHAVYSAPSPAGFYSSPLFFIIRLIAVRQHLFHTEISSQRPQPPVKRIAFDLSYIHCDSLVIGLRLVAVRFRE